jgi:acyl-CoA synthetase (AMP-forming)/AMP-acid ligase II
MTVRTGADDATLVDVLRRRAANDSEQGGYTFLPRERSEQRLTYAQLDRRAREIAGLLRASSAPGDRVLLVLPPDLEYLAAFFGCLYSGRIAVPTYPPRAHRPNPWLEAIAQDTGATVALSNAVVLGRMGEQLSTSPGLGCMRWEDLDAPLDAALEGCTPNVRPDQIAFVQYTSGSTGEPKGVVVRHANLMHNEQAIAEALGHTGATVGVGWLPLFHDMGLIGTALQALYLGSRCILLPAGAFAQSPFRWLQAISTYRANTSGGPNFAYDLCVRKVSVEQRAQLDLSCWTVAVSGGEPVRPETMRRFAAVFGECGFQARSFRPCYGLAEATLLVAAAREAPCPTVRYLDTAALEQHRVVAAPDGALESRPVVGCGAAVSGQEVAIVDPSTGTRRSAEVGEIWVQGASVAAGYWNRPRESASTFAAYLPDGSGPYLRTGDLGFFDDELFVTGRLKDVIIVRGRNLYAHDIEATVSAAHPALRDGAGAAFAVEVADEERLVVVHEARREDVRALDPASVTIAVRQAVVEQYEVEVEAIVLLEPGSIPKTSSGKVKRQACRLDFLAGRLRAVGVDGVVL